MSSNSGFFGSSAASGAKGAVVAGAGDAVGVVASVACGVSVSCVSATGASAGA